MAKFEQEKKKQVNYYSQVLEAFKSKLNDPKDKEEESKKKQQASLQKHIYL